MKNTEELFESIMNFWNENKKTIYVYQNQDNTI